jgi:hypothetical protein
MRSGGFTASISINSSGSYGSNNQLKKEDHLDVRFWAKVDWSEHLDKVTSVDDSHGRATRFLEDENGRIINVARAAAIRDCARGFFNGVEEKFLPRSWGKASIDLQTGLSSLMRSRFLEFQYCADDWKVKSFATEYYYSWYKNWAKSKKLKTEDDSSDVPDTLDNLAKKRRSQSTAPRAKKRARPSTAKGTSPNMDRCSEDTEDKPVESSYSDDEVMDSAPVSGDKGKGRERSVSVSFLFTDSGELSDFAEIANCYSQSPVRNHLCWENIIDKIFRENIFDSAASLQNNFSAASTADIFPGNEEQVVSAASNSDVDMASLISIATHSATATTANTSANTNTLSPAPSTSIPAPAPAPDPAPSNSNSISSDSNTPSSAAQKKAAQKNKKTTKMRPSDSITPR